MPEGSECPPACYTPAPSECQEGEVVCDSGVSDDGCWLGDYCMAEGTVCPTVQGVPKKNSHLGSRLTLGA